MKQLSKTELLDIAAGYATCDCYDHRGNKINMPQIENTSEQQCIATCCDERHAGGYKFESNKPSREVYLSCPGVTLRGYPWDGLPYGAPR
jgi:hypothetical protein